MLTQVQHDERIDPSLVAAFSRDLAALGVAPGARIGIAVSGGGDSLALLLLAHAARPGLIAAATVDHRLRREAADEAAFVADLCAGLGVPHAILAPAEAPTGNVQSAARELRYRLLADWAEAAGLTVLATAHQLDDQAETLLMRLARGSGVGGLAGVRARRKLTDAVTLVRPLLGRRRSELAAIVAAAGIVPVDDPANADGRYDRARLRRALAAAPWLDPVPLARSAAALAEAEAALDWATGRAAGDRTARDGDVVRLDPAGLPDEIVRRLVASIVAGFDPAARPPRGQAAARLVRLLRADRPATLGAARAAPGPIWTFAPAPPHRSS